MDKKIILLATAILLAANASAAWTATVDVNGGYDSQTATAIDETENGIQCVPDDGNFTVTITGGRTFTGVNVTYFGGAGVTTVVNTKGATIDGNGQMTGDLNYHVDIMGAGSFSVAAPTAEGLYRMQVYDANAVDDNTYDEWVAVKPDSTYTEFTFTEDGDSNGFCKINNYSAFLGKIEDSTGYGKLETKDSISWDLSGDIDFDTGINMAATNELQFNLSALQNKRGKITFLKPEIRTSQFQIRRNDSGCSICENVVSNNGEISFTTNRINDSLATYTATELSVGDDVTGGALPIGGGTFQAALPSLAGIADTNTVLLALGALFVGIGIYIYIKKK